ncbi:XLF (XRCC4-like factor) domain containing protein [Rhypophila decipiens]
MSDHESWRPLPVAVPGLPNLLVSTTFAADSYKIRLTDLANVWLESMDRKPIVKRGLVEDTSIDPSDGPDNIRRMLALIRAAFDPSDPEHSTTSMTLGQDDKGGDDAPLVIRLTCILPKPLKPFKWPMHLAKCPQTSLTTQLVLPLIQAHQTRSREIDSLVTALKEKDAVINRLVDKLDASGVSLEYVFNALSGKRRVTREMADEKVKGLAPFREADFKSGMGGLQAAAEPSDVPSLLDNVFGGTGLKYKPDQDLEASSILSDWWTRLGKGKVVFGNPPTSKTANIPSSIPEPESKKGEEDDVDFQVQATPPGLSSRGKRQSPPRPAKDDDDTTSDGESESQIPDSVPVPPKATSSKPFGARLGTIGGHKAIQSSDESPPPAAQPQKNDDSDTASDTASDIDGDEVTNPSPPKPAKRGALGRIGGKARAKTPPKPSRSPTPPTPEKKDTTPARKHRIGVIGRKRPTPEPASHPDSDSEDGRGRSSKTAPAPAVKERKRETSKERADRKRLELEEEIRKKAALGPAKKKRKF